MSRAVDAVDRRAVVIGGSLGGIFAAAALSAGGWAVTLLERDQLPAGAEHRRGVPQDRQAHILLHRGLTAIEGLLPGFRAELVARDAVPFDTGRMPWLGEYGWLSTDVSSWEVVSATRPLMDAVARDLLRRLPRMTVRDGVRVTGLKPTPDGWRVCAEQVGATDADGRSGLLDDFAASVVVDASGRSSRLDHWLPTLGGADEEVVDAMVGYAGRLHVARREIPFDTGLAIFGLVPDGASGLALPVEGGQWMISASGMGDSRPPRDSDGFEAFLAGLRDPAVTDLVSCLEPVGDVAVHRQTANHRRAWGSRQDWPPGLLVVGDALCSFNPIYGQGITVAALQAELLRDHLSTGRPVDRRLQLTVRAATDVPWAISTGNDQKFLDQTITASRLSRLTSGYSSRLARLGATGHVRAGATLSNIYHLMSPPSALFHPALLLAAARPLSHRQLPRPAVLDELSRRRREHPPPARADA
ncbi:MAG TPA: hypothetical protein VEX66_02030 [Microlunatus sp.]|jgi:2-polyprenyl-6-methoxyphenol hydroxylase-like FAD-dependent oxidoreductase|nr:hypothetical protein [Microlunatus sp.]